MLVLSPKDLKHEMLQHNMYNFEITLRSIGEVSESPLYGDLFIHKWLVDLLYAKQVVEPRTVDLDDGSKGSL